MDKKMKCFGIIAAILAFLFCFFAGLWILINLGIQKGTDAINTGLAFYFIGKSIFVGAALLLLVFKKE